MKKYFTGIIVSLSLVAFSLPGVAFAQFDYNYTYPTYTYPTYTTPTYTTPTTYDYNFTYPTYTYPTYTTPDYTTPTYTYPTYTTPTYTTPTYTTPTYTTPTYTTPTVSNYSNPVYGSTYVPTYNYGTSVVPVGNYGSSFNFSYVQQTQTCWNGTVIPTNQTCPAQTQTCPNGMVIPTGSVCPNLTQTCWNGTVIPTTQACPAQYQTCPNGAVILTNQTCPINYGYTNYGYTPTYTTPVVYTQPTYYTQPVYTNTQTIIVNNVVTSIPTQISDTSAKCNGIGLISNNLSSTGWFEYGETSALGRTTQSVNIGTYHTSPFSNVLANLKPNTTYYCRAGMSNSYGTVRGEIVSFTTKSKPVTYVKITPVVTPITYAVKTPVKKSTTICTNEEVILADGQKAVTLLFEKTNGDTTLNGDVTYTLSYKNISSSNLKDVVVKIVIPQEFTFISTTAGNYDEATRNITVNLGVLGSLSEGKISVTSNVSNNSQIGKTVITTGYVVYTVRDSIKVIGVQDEVTTYILGTIMPSVEKTDLGSKKVIGQDSGMSFLPNSLIEWIALLAIIFILMILGRSIYTSYKEDTKKTDKK